MEISRKRNLEIMNILSGTKNTIERISKNLDPVSRDTIYTMMDKPFYFKISKFLFLGISIYELILSSTVIPRIVVALNFNSGQKGIRKSKTMMVLSIIKDIYMR